MKEDVFSQSESLSQIEDRTTGQVELFSSQEKELDIVRIEISYLKYLPPEKVNSIGSPSHGGY
jgi:hypothetical protein